MTEQKFTYKDLWHEKKYLRLLIANLISRFGDSIDVIAYSWIVFELTGSASWLAIIFGINAIPNIIFQPLAGVFVERLDKKRIMIISDYGRGLIAILTALLLFNGLLNPWLLLLFTFMQSMLESLRIPAGLAVYPQIIAKEKYHYASGLSGSLSRIFEIAGMAMAGIIIATFTGGGAIVINALTFMASGLIIATIKLPQDNMCKDLPPLNINQYLVELKEGIKYVKDIPIVWLMCVFGSVIGVLLIPVNTLQTALVVDILNFGPNAISLLSVTMTLGLSFGAYIYPLMHGKYKANILLSICGMIALSTYFIYANVQFIENRNLVIGLLMMASLVFGVSVSIIMTFVSVMFMHKVDQAYMGRAGSIFNATSSLAMPLGSFIFASLAMYLELNVIYSLTAIVGIILFGMLFFNKVLKEV